MERIALTKGDLVTVNTGYLLEQRVVDHELGPVVFFMDGTPLHRDYTYLLPAEYEILEHDTEQRARYFQIMLSTIKAAGALV